ncbi:MAG: Clp protease N-terminal domain-containing protein [Aggregatilineales bacterium]
MPSQQFVSLEELLTLARNESAAQMDYYVGVEHLLLALLRIEGGITAHIFAQRDSSSSYVRFLAQSSGNADATGFLGILTPRASRVIAKAQSYIEQGMHPDERAVLLALLEERDSLVIKRVLRNLDVKRQQLIEEVKACQAQPAINFSLPPIAILNNDSRYTPSPDEQAILQRIFRTSSRVIIERLLSSEGHSYSGARVLLVRAFDHAGREQSPSVIKLHERHQVLWEKMRYNEHVRDKLPASTSHIMTDALPEGSPLGGLKYSFVQGHLDAHSTNLHDFALVQPPQVVAQLLREKLYGVFGATWWNQRRDYNFTVWQEYDLLLPPALELEALPQLPSNARKIQPLHEALRTEGAFHTDELVVLTDFTVLKAKPARNNTVQLVAGSNAEAMNLALRVDVRNFDLAAHPNLHRGTILRQVAGRVIRTRDDILQEQVLALLPDFNFTSDPLPRHPALPTRLPNPLRNYRWLLEAQLSSSFCSMHGDLHVGNILIGRNGEAWLIDFEWTRDGHTLFDWATLETSLLLELLVPRLSDSWDAIWEAIALLEALNRSCYAEPHMLETELFSADHPYAQALIPVMEVRRIAAGLLQRGNWAEYFIPLGLMALRVLNWKERSLAARRFAYALTGLAIQTSREARDHYTSETESNPTDTP